jgi:DNA-binding transcriptional regulator YhcF (GntR family)
MKRKLNNKDFDIFQPKCQILARHLIEEIRAGVYKPGQKMASIRKVAEQYGLGRQVVLSAFDSLAKRNYIYTEIGRGSFVNSDLKQGKFYRLGFFVNRQNIANQGLLLNELCIAAQKNGYELILGNNFESESNFAEWLEKEHQLDGIIVTGVIDDGFLENVRKAHLPYVVIGNYDIAEFHHQVINDIQSKLINSLSPILNKLNVKSCSGVFSDSSFRADREIRKAFKTVLSKAGIDVHSELIPCTSDDGYRLAALLHESSVKPELIYIYYDKHARGFQKYYSINNYKSRPKIIVSSLAAKLLDKKYYDYIANNMINWKPICSKAIKILLKEIS